MELDIINEHSNLAKDCFSGEEFEAMSDQLKISCLSGEGGKVFSRIMPRQKKMLVKYLIDMGEIVAMAGDGINDAPAL
jgi:magnesium-transporting ATPase (P-type)